MLSTALSRLLPPFTAFPSALALLQLFGVFAYAIAGAVAAKRRGLDVVGAISIAFLTSFGGGTLRDLLLGRTPVFWVRHPMDTAVVFVAATFAFYIVRVSSNDRVASREPDEGNSDKRMAVEESSARLLHPDFPHSWLGWVVLIADALGLGIFGATGAAYTIASNMSYLIAALMAVMTGVFGGVLRDVMLNQIPIIFRQRSELYATCVFVGVWAYLALHACKFADGIALMAGAGVIAGLRLFAVLFHWRLPQPPY